MTRLDPDRGIWMRHPATLQVVAALGGRCRFVGGAVRNTLLDRPVEDVDLATPMTPDAVIAALAAAGIKAVPTGIAHGTITAVAQGRPFEITTLRRDVKTFGRQAEVAFTEDWAEDAMRRDFTMNALFAAPDGEVFDHVGGLADVAAGRVRFVGDAAARIREDYLRILRLFRFQAWYGRGPLEPSAVAAAAENRDGLARLSGERIAKEMLKMLAAKDPLPALRAMAQAGILAEIGLDATALERLDRLARVDAKNGFLPDPLLRLAVLGPDGDAIGERWRLSNAQTDRLRAALRAEGVITPSLPHIEARKLLYRLGVRAFNDRLYLNWAADPDAAHDEAWCALLELADFFAPPHFPLSGRDALRAGVAEGPRIGAVLAEVEEWWIEAGFPMDGVSLAAALRMAADKANRDL